jgi:hypothetical protein
MQVSLFAHSAVEDFEERQTGWNDVWVARSGIGRKKGKCGEAGEGKFGPTKSSRIRKVYLRLNFVLNRDLSPT